MKRATLRGETGLAHRFGERGVGPYHRGELIESGLQFQGENGLSQHLPHVRTDHVHAQHLAETRSRPPP